jgi:hypothetical protein
VWATVSAQAFSALRWPESNDTLFHRRIRGMTESEFRNDSMQAYRNRTGESGVAAYRSKPGSIDVEFHDGAIYRYDAKRPGGDEVAAMQRLAAAGQGLATYINQFVRERYARRLR